jgi:hypothetical protein
MITSLINRQAGEPPGQRGQHPIQKVITTFISNAF